MLGRATFTTVLSSITMNSPKHQARRARRWTLRSVASTSPLSGRPAEAASRAVGRGCYGRPVDDLQARRERLLRLCRGLPEATATAHDQHVGFQVRGRTFAWFVDDEHGDGRVAVLCKAPAGGNGA